MEIALYNKIIHLGKELDGVFTLQDLEVLFKDYSRSAFYRVLNKLISAGELISIKRGFFATKDAELSAICSRIYPQSYISTGTVLSQDMIIGSIPARKIQAIKKGVPKVFKTALGTIEYLSINSRLFFGFERKGNANWATPEKAFLDACYFYYKGKKFSFDLIKDVNTDLLDFRTIDSYLKNYNKRFITFFNSRWFKDE